MLLFRTLFVCCFIIVSIASHADSLEVKPANFLPPNAIYNAKIPKPSSSLGFEVGQRHIRHHQLQDYFQILASSASRVQLTSMGKTAQQRDQLLITISSPENLEMLPEFLAKPVGAQRPLTEPLVIWLGYSIHGDEISGANAALLVAYYLAASEEKYIQDILANTIIVLEPSSNPDGMDRFVNWVTTFGNTTDNPDANHIEHHQHWITGRTNHFWFDLNRDWLFLSQQESQQRLAYYHRYQPHVLGDFHEMGHNSSYFFQPGIKDRTHPLTPQGNISLTEALAKYHARALDSQNRLYFSAEKYDDFYYGKSSTYPDINGSIGVLFEQASSRGMQQQTVNGLLTFKESIKNHVLTSLSTINGAWENKAALQKYRNKFYQDAKELADDEEFIGYLLHESKDNYRLNALLSILAQHHINVYPLTKDLERKDRVFTKENSYFVPLEQPQYRLVKALFNQQKNFKDNTFYDVSGWTLPLAMNIEFHPLNRSWGLEVDNKVWQKAEPTINNKLSPNVYAYAFSWQHFLAPKLLNNLLKNNIQVKVATKAFSTTVNGQTKSFSPGSITVLAGLKQPKNWQEILLKTSNDIGIPITPMTTGLTILGSDLGSDTFKVIKQPKVLLLGGQGISQYEVGEIRLYLDKLLNIPVSITDYNRLNRVNLTDYSHIMLVNGNYNKIPEAHVDQLKLWVNAGGVIIGQKKGAQWLAAKDILAAKFASKKQINQLFDEDSLSYADKETLTGRKRIAGAIFETQLDVSHPLAYGYQSTTLPLFRNSTLIMEMPQQAFMTVAKYTPSPLLSGYTDQNLVNRLAYNAAIIAHNYGKGRVIATPDVLTFRGYWYGSAKILANSLFFAKTFSTPLR